MKKREQELLNAAQEILSDFNRYGEVLQVGDNGEYGMESAIGRLNTAIDQCDKGTPAEDRHGREPDNHELWCPHHPEVIRDGQLGECTCKPDKVKPLAQYLGEYLLRFADMFIDFHGQSIDMHETCKTIEQALDAYESTEQVKIRIEPV